MPSSAVFVYVRVNTILSPTGHVAGASVDRRSALLSVGATFNTVSRIWLEINASQQDNSSLSRVVSLATIKVLFTMKTRLLVQEHLCSDHDKSKYIPVFYNPCLIYACIVIFKPNMNHFVNMTLISSMTFDKS